ncbi:MAG TPA: hypothetical protein VFM37_08150 [Pseudonocardiaceae bacterium]|nr:hypothetical protein [Pseudonocardiaceae bacterium]
MGYNPNQPRIPKGFPGAGRFMKAGATLTAARAATPTRGDRPTGPRRLGKAGKTLAELRSEAAFEGLTPPRRATKAQIAQSLDDFRTNRDRGHAAAFADPKPATSGRPYGEADRRRMRDDMAAIGKANIVAIQTEALRAMNSREEGAAYVAGIRGSALTELARSVHALGGTVAEKRARIVQTLVGARLDHAAIREASAATFSFSGNVGATGTDRLSQQRAKREQRRIDGLLANRRRT